MVKKVAMIHEFDQCYECPYCEGGVMSAVHCYYFYPPVMIANSNGKLVTKMINGYPEFCELPDDEVFNGV